MVRKKRENAGRYQLRYAAGEYWLLDMEQSGVPYVKPLSVNETGARIWLLLEQGYRWEDIADKLAEEYHTDREQVVRDMMQFRSELMKKGISI